MSNENPTERTDFDRQNEAMALGALVQAKSTNRFWGANFGDRVEVAFANEKRITAPNEDPQAVINYFAAVSMDVDLATKLRDFLTNLLDLRSAAPADGGEN